MQSLSITFNSPYPSLPIREWLFAIISGQFHKTKNEIELEIAQITKSQENPKEFGPIYDKYYDEIFVYIGRRIEDIDIVAEITSRTFTSCLANIHKFRYMGVPFSAWLYKIAINEVRQFFRAKKNYPRIVSITESDLAEISQETVDESKFERAHEILPKLLSTLGEKDLQCIELRFFEKKSFKEIGFLLGLSEVNAKVRTYRILKKLRKIAVSN